MRRGSRMFGRGMVEGRGGVVPKIEQVVDVGTWTVGHVGPTYGDRCRQSIMWWRLVNGLESREAGGFH